MDVAVNPLDIIGLCGVACSTSAYAWVQLHREFANRILYSALNLLSAVLIGISFFGSWNLTTFICNAVWGVISVFGLYRSIRLLHRALAIKNQQTVSP